MNGVNKTIFIDNYWALAVGIYLNKTLIII